MQQNNNDELQHYGVMGMKWGIRRAARKQAQMARLNKRIKKFEVKSANLAKKSEKVHAREDLGESNRAAIQAANLKKKAAKASYKATKASNDLERSMYENKAAKYEFKSTKKQMKANQLSKTTGYGAKAMLYSIKSDKAQIKAEKAKAKLAKNQLYINKMNSKLKTVTPEERAKVQSYIDKYLK